MVKLGSFADLRSLTQILNRAWQDLEYRLEPVPGKKDTYLFVEDPLDEDTYSCGVIKKKGGDAFALSKDVYDLVMGAYSRYQQEN